MNTNDNNRCNQQHENRNDRCTQQHGNCIVITDCAAYDDLTVGNAVFHIGRRHRRLRVCWLTNLGTCVLGSNHMPRGEFRLHYGCVGIHSIAFRLSLSRRFTLPMLPLKTKRWIDFGADVYLMDTDDRPLSNETYDQLVRLLYVNEVKTVVIQPDAATVDGNYLYHEQPFSLEGWDED